jgi:hypothetical protein
MGPISLAYRRMEGDNKAKGEETDKETMESRTFLFH